MKKTLLFTLVLLTINLGFSQVKKINVESSTRKFIDEASFTRLDKDWSTTAIFKSGIGEHVKFYPIVVTDLKTKETTRALELNMFIKKPDVYKTAWVGLEEIDEFITFIEDNVVPNIELKYKKKSSEFVFKANEITLIYFVYEKTRRLTIKLNAYDDSENKNYTFWTETQVDKVPYLLEVLKVIK